MKKLILAVVILAVAGIAWCYESKMKHVMGASADLTAEGPHAIWYSGVADNKDVEIVGMSDGTVKWTHR